MLFFGASRRKIRRFSISVAVVPLSIVTTDVATSWDMATPQRESLLRRGLTVCLDTNCYSSFLLHAQWTAGTSLLHVLDTKPFVSVVTCTCGREWWTVCQRYTTVETKDGLYPVWRCSTVRLETGYVSQQVELLHWECMDMAVLQWVIHSTSLVVTVTMVTAIITVFTHWAHRPFTGWSYHPLQYSHITTQSGGAPHTTPLRVGYKPSFVLIVRHTVYTSHMYTYYRQMVWCTVVEQARTCCSLGVKKLASNSWYDKQSGHAWVMTHVEESPYQDSLSVTTDSGTHYRDQKRLIFLLEAPRITMGGAKLVHMGLKLWISLYSLDLDIITLTHYYCLTAVLILFTMNVLWWAAGLH